ADGGNLHPLLAGNAFGVSRIAVYLDHPVLGNATRLVQRIDILGDDMGDDAARHQLGDGAMAVIGPDLVPGLFHFEAAAPAFAPCRGIGDIVGEVDRHHAGPDPAWR